MFSDDSFLPSDSSGAAKGAPAWAAFFDSQAQLDAFVQIAELGSFSAAARRLGLGAVALRRLATRVEQRQGERLFTRHAEQVQLTAAGERLYAVARMIPGATRAARPGLPERAVTVSIDEPLTHDLLRRGLMRFLRSNAGARLTLQQTNCTGVAQASADVSVQLGDIVTLSAREGCHARSLGKLRFAPFEGRRQAQRQHGAEAPLLVHYRGYDQLAALSDWHQLVRQCDGGVLRVDSSDLVRECLRWSAAVGLLPHYSHLIDRELIPVTGLVPALPPIDVVLTVRSDSAEAPQVAAVVTMLEQLYHDRRAWLVGG